MATTLQAQAGAFKSINAAEKGDAAIMCHLIRTDVAIAYRVKNFLVSAGAWPKEKISVRRGSKVQAKGWDDIAALEASEAGASGSNAEEEVQEQPETKVKTPEKSKQHPRWSMTPEIHRNFRVWEAVPPSQLRVITSAVEPIACNDNNLYSMMSKGMREVPRGPMLEVFECWSEKQPSEEVGKTRLVTEVIEDMKVLNESNGNPCADIVFPARGMKMDWQKYGRYRFTTHYVTGRLVLYKATSGQWLIMDPSVGDRKNLRIDENFSVHRARIVNISKPSQKPIMCCLLFADKSKVETTVLVSRDGTFPAAKAPAGPLPLEDREPMAKPGVAQTTEGVADKGEGAESDGSSESSRSELTRKLSELLAQPPTVEALMDDAAWDPVMKALSSRKRQAEAEKSFVPMPPQKKAA